MLQKEFFQVQPFNPNPYWDPVIVNLSGAQKFEEDTVFMPGRYKVIVQAGGAYPTTSSGSGKIEQIVLVQEPFIIKAYCGSKGTQNSGGVNLYTGPFKVNPIQGDVPSVNHIFGNCGGCSKGVNGVAEGYGSGNSLGNGIIYYASGGYPQACGAGSCLHFIPLNGVFGTDYLFAFHTTSASACIGVFLQTGSGSAYGGSASGGASSTGSQGMYAQQGYLGGNTPYGSGGARSWSGKGLLAYGYGYDGTGIGHGYAGEMDPSDYDYKGKGAAAWYNGTNWVQSDNWANPGEEGKIVVEYLGPLE